MTFTKFIVEVAVADKSCISDISILRFQLSKLFSESSPRYPKNKFDVWNYYNI